MVSALAQYHKPALLTLAGIATGIILSEHFFSEHSLLLKASFYCALVFLLAAIFLRDKNLRSGALILLTVSVGTFIHSFTESRFEQSALKKLSVIPDKEITLFGKAVSNGDDNSHSTLFLIAADSIQIERVTLTTNDRLALEIPHARKHDGCPLPRPGDELVVRGELSPSEKFRNPYENNYTERIRRTQNVSAFMYLRSRFDYSIRSHGAGRSVVEHIFSLGASLREKISNTIARTIRDSLTSGFVGAVLVGTGGNLSPETWKDFQKAGLSHILVVSGFNLAIVSIFFYYLLHLLRIRSRWILAISTIIVALIYAVTVGPQPSLIRAVIVVVLFLAAKLSERKPDLANITAAAACINLLLNPNELFDVSFQLSYASVFSLAIIAPELDRLFTFDQDEGEKAGIFTKLFTRSKDAPPNKTKLKKGPFTKYVKPAFIGTLSVFLGNLPIVLYHFHQASILGLFVNIIAIPFSGLVTILGMLLLPLSLLSEYLASIYADVLSFFVQLITWLSKTSADLPFSVLRLPIPATPIILLYFLMLAFLLVSVHRVKFFARISVLASAVFLLISLNVPFASALAERKDAVSIFFFDVGQGDAALISTPNAKHYLIDFGGVLASGRTQAERSIIPLLRAEGISSVDGGIISHTHFDHYGGLLPLLKEGLMKTVYTSGERTQSYTAWQLDSIAYADHLPVCFLKAGDRLTLDKDVYLYILAPDAGEIKNISYTDGSDFNHHSIVAKLVYNHSSALFLGDLDGRSEQDITDRYGDLLKSDLVKIAHHGSKTSSVPEIIKTVQAKYAVVSVGEHNKFGHPSTSVLYRWARSGAQIKRTDKNGAVLFRSEGESFKEVSWK